MNDDAHIQNALRARNLEERRAQRMLNVDMDRYKNIFSPIELYLQWYFVNMSLLDDASSTTTEPRRKRKLADRHLELLESNLEKIREILALCTAKIEETEDRMHMVRHSSLTSDSDETSITASSNSGEDFCASSSSSSESLFENDESKSKDSDEEAEEECS